MTRALFISMDGPKGTGKTTLLEAVTTALRADNLKVVRLCERKSDPCRAQTMALVNTFARDPSRDLELEVCERFADSRSWITQHVLAAQPPDSIILMDRWYPSDAAFRRLIPFADILELNINRQVQVPDLHVGVVTAAQISWARAAARRRGLSSTVMSKLEEQVACTEAFERAAVEQGWVMCRNEGTIEEAVRRVVLQIYKVLHPKHQE
ncbi:Thymidylate kinase [Pseudomonas fluorescens]|uniref:Thymidylate kinase n=1 Tax=Pseudomonas azotoformans TaxID=47878 RepID=A0A4Q0HNH4_PSEAZ|nr:MULTISPECIES: dTMP kinase [Pseudomonas]KRP95017.1 thymidylate kinase [Pseudomonas lactis]KWV77373.1 Thymidylate kinase [Pseudomonas fluorescens]MBJ2306343.1 thymidylate kinase [Pseudomonas sp. MF2846]MBK3491789.1 thymidylate kinase [Pseudomonas sp. MF2857]MCR8665080.1 thymidylate kinase [Pseudomonas carnis]